MALTKEYITYITDCFSCLDDVTPKRMFGGLGLFHQGLMFGVVLKTGGLYLKVDEQNLPDYSAHGCEEWSYPRKDGKISNMGYWSIPEGLLDDRTLLSDWALKSFDAAKRADGAKPKSKRKWTGAIE